ncbi:MAG: PAS domain S-box protein [Spirochaetales bacterium]|nr:PAS domain S-box protein [Spirochaetales bacterium]
MGRRDRKQAELSLKESQKKYKEMVQLLPLGIFETDNEGRFTFVNDKTMEYIGAAEKA